MDAAPIRTATLADLRFTDSLQRKFGNCVGFLPRPAIEHHLEAGNVLLAQENEDPAGYILTNSKLIWQPLLKPIYQACVAMDAQRRHHGLAMLEAITAQAIAAKQLGLQANCAEGLDANEFWRAAGFKPIVIMTPANVRHRAVICWRKPLTRRLPVWFMLPPARAGYLARRPQSIRNPRKDYHELISSLGLSRTTKASAPDQRAEVTQAV